MDLPESCRDAVNRLTEHTDIFAMRAAAAAMTEKYKTESGRGQTLVSGETAVKAYAAVRMPATYGAAASALGWTLETLDESVKNNIRTVLDLGAGTGAGAWAVYERLPSFSQIVCVEREEQMLTVGKKLMEGHPLYDAAAWISGDAAETAEKLACSGRTFDLVLSSYMTNEMTQQRRKALLSLMWRLTDGILLLIEPGTPVGFSIIKDAREQLRSLGGRITAPCPHEGACPLAENDWCHFTCRVARTKLHKLLKGGDVPYEDEKFSYIAAAKAPCDPAPARILRHPLTEAGRITLSLCTRSGLKTEVVTKRDKAAFTAARKSGWGDKRN